MRGRSIRVRGQVQGVGFRPFVWQLAKQYNLRGQVLNDTEGVLIQAAGEALDAFEAALVAEAPPLSRIDAVESVEMDVHLPDVFEIVASRGQGAETSVTPDAATCDACLTEIQDPDDRRFGYAFANCTHCGPRFTILHRLPYDRSQTTMADFDMCADCRAEYSDPADRRFHAQPVACPACGPRIWIEPPGAGNPLEQAADRLRKGEILAIKGLGGFHLACDARNDQSVALLRSRKHRPAKPLALMGTLDMIRRHSHVCDTERALLEDPAAPIVLLGKAGEVLPESLAPGQATLGWMLPSTPLHHLLLAAFAGPLVMTSGNRSGEPLATGNEEARQTLSGFADTFVMHDREIARRLDDSVERVTRHGPMVLRRARGRVPGTLPLPPGFESTPQVVAYGGQMKAAICLLKNGQALLGHHLGELDEALTWDAFIQADHDYADLFDHQPERIAIDLHPDFRASRYGTARADREGRELVSIQHHHAHLAACMGENGWPRHRGRVAGIILDGLGLGPDGTVWGGEVLLGDYVAFERRAWLKQAPLIGGDRAQTEPWRNALVRLDAAGLTAWADKLFHDVQLDLARQAALKGINSPLSSSAGRLFDAVSACLGICAMSQSFEGEAAMRLEATASAFTAEPYEFQTQGREIDTDAVFRAIHDDLMAGVAEGEVARRFHAGLAKAFALQARELVDAGEAEAVALSGGCFQNALLLDETLNWLQDTPVLIHTRTPANDGGIALGQALIAAAQG